MGALDWVAPVPGKDQTLPVCVLLHGAFQDSTSVTMSDLARSLSNRGMPVVVMNRRGYGGLVLDQPKLQIFGDDDDLDEVVALVSQQEPNRSIAIIGFSCGSGFAARYIGNRSRFSAWPPRNGNGSTPRLLCGVMYDPGYDVSPEGAIAKIRFPYSWFLNWSLKYHYAFRHHRSILNNAPQTAREGALDMMSPKANAVDTFKAARRLSGMYATHGDSSAWLDKQQPRVNAMDMPSLCINSRDDPICVWENVEAYRSQLDSNPNIALVELHRGAHGCKFGFWGFGTIVDPIIWEFIEACWQELQTHRGSNGVGKCPNEETSY